MLLYQQIRQYIFALIEQQQIMKKLPSERDLQEHFKSTRITVREALMHLEVEGIVYRLNRKGWFLCPPRLQWNPVQKVNFYQLAKEQSFFAETKLVHIKTLAKGNNFSTNFSEQNDSDESSLFEICRVRSLDARPVMVEEIYCKTKQFQSLADKNLEGSITNIFTQDYGVIISRESSRIFVTGLPADKAKYLQLNNGASCLKIVRKRFSPDNTLVDYNIEYWVHGAIEINVASE